MARAFPLNRFTQAGVSPTQIAALQTAWNLLSSAAQDAEATYLASIDNVTVASIAGFPSTGGSTPPAVVSTGQIIEVLNGGAGAAIGSPVVGGTAAEGSLLAVDASGNLVAGPATQAVLTNTSGAPTAGQVPVFTGAGNATSPGAPTIALPAAVVEDANVAGATQVDSTGLTVGQVLAKDATTGLLKPSNLNVSVQWVGVWSSGTTYAAGQGVAGPDGLGYVSLVAGNVGHTPVGDGGVHWGAIVPASVVMPTAFVGDATAVGKVFAFPSNTRSLFSGSYTLAQTVDPAHYTAGTNIDTQSTVSTAPATAAAISAYTHSSPAAVIAPNSGGTAFLVTGTTGLIGAASFNVGQALGETTSIVKSVPATPTSTFVGGFLAGSFLSNLTQFLGWRIGSTNNYALIGLTSSAPLATVGTSSFSVFQSTTVIAAVGDVVSVSLEQDVATVGGSQTFVYVLKLTVNGNVIASYTLTSAQVTAYLANTQAGFFGPPGNTTALLGVTTWSAPVNTPEIRRMVTVGPDGRLPDFVLNADSPRVYNPRSYVASGVSWDPTGAADMSPAINAAILQAHTDWVAAGSDPELLYVVQMEAGKFLCLSTVNMLDGILLAGMGLKATKIYSSAAGPAIQGAHNAGATSPAGTISFRDFCVDGSLQNNGTTYTTSLKGIACSNQLVVRLLRVRVENTWSTGFAIDMCPDYVLVDIEVVGCGRGIAQYDSQTNLGSVLEHYSGHSGIGIGIGENPLVNQGLIIGALLTDNGMGGLFIEQQNPANNTGVVNSFTQGLKATGIYAARNAYGFIDAGCWGADVDGMFIYNKISGIRISGTLISADAGKAGRITGQIAWNGTSGYSKSGGVWIGGMKRAGTSDAQGSLYEIAAEVHDNTGVGIGSDATSPLGASVSIGKSRIWSNSGDGVQINSNAAVSYLDISDLDSHDNGGWNINIPAATTGLTALATKTRGGTSGGLQVTGAASDPEIRGGSYRDSKSVTGTVTGGSIGGNVVAGAIDAP